MIAAVLAVLAITSLGAALRSPRRAPATVELARRSTLGPREIAAEADAARPVWERIAEPVITALARRLRPSWAGLSADDLRRAGVDTDHFGVSDLLACKVLGAIAAATPAALLAAAAPGAIVLLPAAAFGGFLLPSVVITRRRAARNRAMLSELPDLVGLLKAFVTAGIPLEQALHLISAQRGRAATPNLLALEVRRALSDYGLGMTIEQALETMGQRTGIEEMQLLASALAQGKRQGAGMEAILRDQESVIRLAQRNRASGEASRVATRLVGVLVLVYLPEFMVLIMIPLFYGIFLKAFG